MSGPPNVILIMADQLRHDFITPAYMPHVCELMNESARFPRMYCASPLCVPARGAFFTGRYPNETGCLVNGWEPVDRAHGQVAAGTPNLYETFESAGYDSWHVGKQHLITADTFDKNPRSQTRWITDEEDYATHLQKIGQRKPGGPRFTGICPELHARKTTAARRYSIPRTGNYEGGIAGSCDGFILQECERAIEQRDPAKPFLLNAMFTGPHPPFDVPSPWFERHQDVPMPQNVGVWNGLQSPLNLYHMAGAIGARYERDEWAEPWRVYAGLVSLVDHCVGRIIAKLKAAGIYENSLILFTSDHGEMLGSHCLWQKMVLYEESARTPLSLRLPGGAHAGVSSDHAQSHIDVFPTLCDFAGITPPPNLSGTSLRPLISGASADSQRPVFVQSDGNGSLEKWSRCIIRGTTKLIVDGFKDEVFFELYDLANDPTEQHNLAFTHPEKGDACLELLTSHLDETNDGIHFDSDTYAQFRINYAYQIPSSH